MPYVFTYNLMPANKANEVAEVYVKALKEERSATRPLAKEVIPNAVKATMEGIESISVHDVKEGKLEEFMNVQQNIMVKYHDIEGYKYKIEVRFKITEALSMIGMKMPE